MATTRDGNTITITKDTAVVQVEGANFAVASGVKTFGTPFTGDVNAATAQAAYQTLTAPQAGKLWQRVQMFVRWSAAPAAPVAGTPDAVVVIYWQDNVTWNILGHWPIKYIDSSSSVADMQTFSDYSEIPFPARTTKLAVGVAGYVDGDFRVDLETIA